MSLILYFVAVFSTLVIQSTHGFGPYSDPHFLEDRRVIVQLMEWKFSEIAKECTEFLGPYGYGGVQLSPIAANAIITSPFRPWWERYQPVGYTIIGRSGNEAEFADMVDKCNKANVRVYVDVILNHMSGGQAGKGTDGSTYNGTSMDYKGVPYSYLDFHGHESCPTSDLEIPSDGYDKPVIARNCRLGGLRDLNQGKEWVIQKQTDFLNKMIDIGVAGFRSDASKHQWPADMTAIISSLHNLNTKYFTAGSRPFFAHEFIQGGTNMRSEEYFGIGRVIEFRYFEKLAGVLRKWKDEKGNLQRLNFTQNFGEGWGFLNSEDSLVMIDSHDLQRGHTGRLGLNINYFESRLLKMATAFMLAWPYAITRVMSSYYWPQTIKDGSDINDWMGPPNTNGEIKAVTRYANLTCNYKEWVCEHRWRQIYNMVKFRNIAGDEKVTNWWHNWNNAIAFGRGNKAFIVINNEDSVVDNTFQTGLPAGKYCDIITGNLEGAKCTGNSITVQTDGTAHIIVDNKTDDPIAAFHIKAKLS